jgi:hypothetical protein
MTNERERFWSAVDEALDARRDPCEVALVQEWIADHPEDADELARLLRGVDVVGRSRVRAPRKLVPMLAAVALVAIGVHLWTRAPAPIEPQRTGHSRVVSFSIEITRESEGETTVVRCDADRTERSQVSRLGSTLIVSSLESRLP